MRKLFLPSLVAALLSISCSDDSSNPGVLDVPGEEGSSKPALLSNVVSGSVEAESFGNARVDLIELSESLSPTGNAATGFLDSTGGFSAIVESFTSPYVEVVVSGSAVLPCTGDTYESKMSVVVDLTKESFVSVNLFSFFASERAKALVKGEKMEFAKAWEQAEKDVAKWFAISNDSASLKSLRFDGEGSSPELHYFSLLFERFALEVLNGKYTEVRESMAKLFAKGGDLSKDSLFYALGAAALSYDMKFPKSSWCHTKENLNVDNTEAMSYFHVLWTTLMGKKACSESLKGESFLIDNPVSGGGKIPLIYGTKTFYLCDGTAWQYDGLDVIKAKYDGAEGLIDGEVVEQKYVYDKESGWRYATPKEISWMQGCVSSNEGVVRYPDICRNGSWVELPSDSLDVMGVDCSEEGKTFEGKYTGREYVCVSGKPLRLSEMDKKVGDYCTEERRGDTAYVGVTPFICRDTWEYIMPDSLDEWLKDSRDDNRYLIVRMGAYRWMGANLRYADTVATPNLAGNIWSKSGNPCDGTFPPFYSWTAAMDLPDDVDPDTVKFTLPHRGVCPEGWHMPSKADWDSLFAFAEKFGPAGKMAHSLMGGYTWALYEQVLNTFGFNIPASGRREADGTFKNEERYAYYWFVTQEESKLQYYYLWNSKEEAFVGKSSTPDLGFPVRCVEDVK